jgi:hypothetical protein
MLGPGSIYRALVPVWRKFINPTRDECAMPGTKVDPPASSSTSRQSAAIDPRAEAMAYWAVTQLQPHRERVAEHFLGQFGFEVHLPRVPPYLVRWPRRIEYQTPYSPGYCFTRIELQWHSVRECSGVIRLVKIGSDEPVHVPGAIDLPNEKRGWKNPRVGDRVQIISVGHSGLCTQVSRQQIGVLLLMFKAQRQARLRRESTWYSGRETPLHQGSPVAVWLLGTNRSQMRLSGQIECAWLGAERKRTMDGGLKNQWQVALIWMRDVNMAAADREPRGMLTHLASREIAEHHLDTYFEMVDAQLTGS